MEVAKAAAKDADVAAAAATVDPPIAIADAAVREAGVLRVATATAATVPRHHPDHPEAAVVGIATSDTAVHLRRRETAMIPATIAVLRRLIIILVSIRTICVIGMVREIMVRTVVTVVRRVHLTEEEEVRILTTAALPQVKAVETVVMVAAVAVAAVLRRVRAAAADLLLQVVAANVVAETKDLPV